MTSLLNRCPHCQRILEKDASFCVGCGTHLDSGKHENSDVLDVDQEGHIHVKSDSDQKKRSFKLPNLSFISGKFIFYLVLCAGLGYGFYEYVYPLFLKIKMDKVTFALSQYDFNQARSALFGLEGKGKKDFRDRVSKMIDQVDLDEKNKIKENYSNPGIHLVVQEVIGMPIDLIYVRFHITNESKKKEISLDPRHFYLKTISGKGEICLNRLQNDEVSVGKELLSSRSAAHGGICVKFFPIIRMDVESGQYELIYLVYNNGKDYAAARINPRRIIFHGAEYKFKPYWQAGKDKPKFRQFVSLNPRNRRKRPEYDPLKVKSFR